MRKVKKVIKPAYLKALNIISCVLLVIGAILRFVHCFTGEEGFNFFFFCSSIYFFVFIFITAAVIVAPDTNKFSIFCRTYFNFLDKTFGRGVFMFFLGINMLERRVKGEVFMCIIVSVISFVNMILGFGDAKKKMASLPWEKGTAAASAGAPAQEAPK